MWSTEYMSLFMLALYTLLDIIFIARIPSSLGVLQINIITAVAIIAFAMWHEQTGNQLALALRSFYVLPVGYMMYSQSHLYIRRLNPRDFDSILARWDHALFGVNPVDWFHQFSFPLLTEYLQIWYCAFQLMLVVLAIDLYLDKKPREFRLVTSTLILGFYISYILYVFMPAIGPRFAGHSFENIDAELPGVFMTHALRAFINAGNNIGPHLHYPYPGVNPDCMPSGHTMMSVMAICLAWKYRARVRWFVTVGGVSVVLSTMYLRYHYVVDVIAGTLLGLIVYALHRWVARLWEESGITV
jgi:membrane-associated phospholipid phosphatase